MTTIDWIRSELLARPEVRDWPQMVDFVNRPLKPNAEPCWSYAEDACEAVGGDRRRARPPAVVIFCLYASIHLTDELIDDEPQGLHRRLGIGQVANMAAMFHSLGTLLVQDYEEFRGLESTVLRWAAEMMAATSFGQELDSRDVQTEEDYWRMAERKTPPLFRFAFQVGSLVGGATIDQAVQIGDLAADLGQLIQLSDDLSDALAVPPKADWTRFGTNLPILFARTVDHPERDRFQALAPRAMSDEAALEELQEILVRSGAPSYVFYRISEAFKRLLPAARNSRVDEPEILEALVRRHVRPMRSILAKVGIDADIILGGP